MVRKKQPPTFEERLHAKCDRTLADQLAEEGFALAFNSRVQQAAVSEPAMPQDKLDWYLESEEPSAISGWLRHLARLVGIETWPAVLVDVAPGRDPAEELARWNEFGYPAASLPTFPDATPGLMLASWGLILVRVPPHQKHRYLGALALDEAVVRLYDTGQVVKLPEPIYDEALEPELVDSGQLVWRGEPPRGLDRAKAGKGVRVAVVDSGIDDGHPAFRKVNVVARKDFTSGGEGPDDFNGHGTHCAGIIAARPVGGSEVQGVAPGVDLIDAKVFDKSGMGSTMAIAAGLHWAVNEAKAQVVNMSLGGAGVSDGQSMLSRLCDAMASQGVVVVVSAGNDGSKGISVPGDAARAITVAAVDKQGNVTSFSSRGPTADPSRTGDKPNLAAPGQDIVAPRSRQCERGAGDYVAMSGTSMAAPHVAGAAAALLGMDGDHDPEKVCQAMLAGCHRLDASKEAAGRGHLDVCQAARVLRGESNTGVAAVPVWALGAGGLVALTALGLLGWWLLSPEDPASVAPMDEVPEPPVVVLAEDEVEELLDASVQELDRPDTTPVLPGGSADVAEGGPGDALVDAGATVQEGRSGGPPPPPPPPSEGEADVEPALVDAALAGGAVVLEATRRSPLAGAVLTRPSREPDRTLAGCWKLWDDERLLAKKVVSGDSLIEWGQWYYAGKDAVAAWNGLGSSASLNRGDWLMVSLDHVEVVIHPVKAGETAFSLQQQYVLPTKYFAAAWNCAPAGKIQAGKDYLVLRR